MVSLIFKSNYEETIIYALSKLVRTCKTKFNKQDKLVTLQELIDYNVLPI